MTEAPTAATDILRQTFGVVTFPGGVRRLSEETRALAARVLAGEYGRAMGPAAFGLTPEQNALPPELRAAMAVKLIAEKAPLRIEPGERLAGASTLIEAARHQMPVANVPGTSHTTLGFDVALKSGLRGVRARITERRGRGGLTAQQATFLDAMTLCLDAMQVWHQRLMGELERRAAASTGATRRTFDDVRRHLAQVPENPPRSFREALQALWFLWEFQRLCGNWSGLGRVDMMLGPFLSRDLAEGAI
ncbi:MAG: hypothetical protein FJ272_22200, partial [Planctomycetes bacterium]|nr:hypothetical protein [Planctomycetota bacterium]